MSILRWVGLLFGLFTLLQAFALFRRARIRRFDFSVGVLFSVALMIVSVVPASVNLLRDLLSLERDQFSRLIAIAIASNLLLWLLLFYTRFRWSEHLDQFDRLVRQLGVAEFTRQHPELRALPRLLVVIPAYEEEANIGEVLREIPEQIAGDERAVLVVDDGSRDDTARVARDAGALVAANPINRGGGAALRLGFDIAREYGVEIVVTMDADGQHVGAEIERLVAPISLGESDFVIGSRILGQREADSALRYLGIHVFNTLIRLLTPVKITDCSNGFRAFRVGALSQLLLRQDQFHTSELIIDAARRGFSISEAPVTVRRRQSGASKKGREWSYGLSFARTVLKTWWR